MKIDQNIFISYKMVKITCEHKKLIKGWKLVNEKEMSVSDKY